MVKWILLCGLLLTGCNVYHAPSGKAFPHGWGKPPEIQTKDYVLLPYGYGYGSSTLKHWIESSNRKSNIIDALNNNRGLPPIFLK